MEQRYFSRFYRDHVQRIYKFVFYRVGGRKDLAEDLTQEIFLKAFEAFDRYDPALSQSSWIYTIARNHVINHHAKSHPGVTLDDVEGTIMAAEDARPKFAQAYDEEQLLQAVDKLPTEEARLVRMKYLEGWSFDELAEIFEKTSGALRVQARRAMKKVQQWVQHPHSLL